VVAVDTDPIEEYLISMMGVGFSSGFCTCLS